MRKLILPSLLLFLSVGAHAPALRASSLVPPPMTPAQAAIYDRVTSRVLAPCCWSQPVQIHQSEAADRVRAEIVARLKQGSGEAAILDRLAAEYGERILGEPRGSRATVAWMTPYAVLATACAGLMVGLTRIARRPRRLSAYPGLLPELPEADL